MKASDLKWDDVPFFDADEWDTADAYFKEKYADQGIEGHILDFIDARLILTLSALRVEYGKPIRLSPLAGAWVRLDGSRRSQHYGVERLSTAGDVFPEGDAKDLQRFYELAKKHFKGAGIYADTIGPNETGIMFHLDLRNVMETFVWASEKVYTDGRHKRVYHYPVNGGSEEARYVDVVTRLLYS